jgi:tetratricopeptide (TPR) repeat protein
MKAIILILPLWVLWQTTPDIYTSANADFEAGRWADAAAKYEAVLKEDGTHIPSRFNLAVCYTKTGDMERAIATYRTLLGQNETLYEAHVNLAILLEQTGKRQDAGDQFEKAAALRPDDGQAQLNLGMFYMRSDEIDKAYTHLLVAAEKGVTSAGLYAALSEAEHARKNEAKSREYLEKAISLDPQNIGLRKQLANSYFDDKDYTKAVPVLVDIVRAEPTSVEYMYLLGKSYEQLKAYPQATTVLEQVIRLKSDHVQAYLTLGVVFYAQQDWNHAAQALGRVIEIRPNEALPHFVLATCLDNLGNAKEAIVQYNKFLELDDGSSDPRSFQARQRAKTLERRLKR